MCNFLYLSRSNAMNAEYILKDSTRLKSGTFSLYYFFKKIVQQRAFRSKKKLQSKTVEKNQPFSFSEKDGVLNLEISSTLIKTLLSQRLICAADVKCLDVGSKECLKKLCLNTCLYSMPHCDYKPHKLQIPLQLT